MLPPFVSATLSNRPAYDTHYRIPHSLFKWTASLELAGRQRRRAVRVFACCLLLVVTCTLGLVMYIHRNPEVLRTEFVQRIIGPSRLPPLYREFREAESMLPQHFTKTPFAHGQKYLWVASHSSWSGWGNVMQDMILTAQLTYAAGRTYVFDDYSWDRDGPAFAKFNGKLIPSRIPLSAIISGPVVGGEFADGDATWRSVSKVHWDKICPTPYIVDGKKVREIHGEGASSQKIIDTWTEYLAQIDDPCVEVSRDSGNIFHPFMFGSREEMLPVWPSLSQSPILTLFGWSTLAHSAFEKNRFLFSPPSVLSEYSASPACPLCVDRYAPLDGLLAIHVRRGDFLDHCVNLGHWGAAFNAFNQFPEFSDAWEVPQGSDEDKMAVYLRRCIPTIEQIVDKVEEVRKTPAGHNLRNLYVMTNGDVEWLSSLKSALRIAFPWQRIATSRDMELTWEQKYVSQSVDMLIGERAQVIIGNGFSSLTSNVAMLRMARGFPPESTRMW